MDALEIIVLSLGEALADLEAVSFKHATLAVEHERQEGLLQSALDAAEPPSAKISLPRGRGDPHSLRVQAIAVLSGADFTESDIGQVLRLSKATVSHHVARIAGSADV